MRSKLTRDQVFIQTGLAAEWGARGRAEGHAEGRAEGEARGEVRGEQKKAADIAKNMLRKGFSAEQTSELSGLDIAKVKLLSTSLYL